MNKSKKQKNESKNEKINKNKVILLILVCMLILVLMMIIKVNSKAGKLKAENQIPVSTKSKSNIEMDWKLTLVNSENKLPDNYNITLESIDEYRKFDSRAIEYLKNMINDMRKQDVGGIWVQSSYRSVEEQTRIYNDKVESYRNNGKKLSDAKRLTEQVISKPRV